MKLYNLIVNNFDDENGNVIMRRNCARAIRLNLIPYSATLNETNVFYN